MVATIEALPDDPDMLKAMLLSERAESERLHQIIKELQRHRFGRRAETLPEEQLQLGLEDVEQVEAAGHAGARRTFWPSVRSVPHDAGRTAAPYRPICRASKRWSIWRAQSAPAAPVRCTGSARTSPNGSTSCRPSSGCWSCAGPNTPAAPAKTS